MSNRKLMMISLIPIVFAILEMVLWFTNIRYDSASGSWILHGNLSFLAVMGFFSLPFICFILEMAGLVFSIKQKHTSFRSVFIAELLLNFLAIFFSVREFYYGLSI